MLTDLYKTNSSRDYIHNTRYLEYTEKNDNLIRKVD